MDFNNFFFRSVFFPHRCQGWTPDFMPPIMDRKFADLVVPVEQREIGEREIGERFIKRDLFTTH